VGETGGIFMDIQQIRQTPVWELYEKGSANKRVSYYEREGTHFLSRTDWMIYMQAFKEIMKNEISK
jgi:hypothetical protein